MRVLTLVSEDADIKWHARVHMYRVGEDKDYLDCKGAKGWVQRIFSL